MFPSFYLDCFLYGKLNTHCLLVKWENNFVSDLFILKACKKVNNKEVLNEALAPLLKIL